MAFYFLAKDPMDVKILIGSYISATFVIRMLIVLIEVPILKFANKITPIDEQQDKVEQRV